MDQPGFQIGAYSVLSRLGVGGMGEVWLATREGQKCVVKTLLPHLAGDERVREMFLKEGRVASMISDPSVVKLYELGSIGDQFFMALEYVEGVSLDRLLGSKRRLSPLVTAYLAARACSGLQAIHEQARPETGETMKIVHRDISPSNLLLSVDGEVKVADFGIAKTYTTDPGGQTTHGTTKGKIAYMSPEQARGQAVDQRTDLFALGVLMYEALAGEIPYTRSKNDFEMLNQVVYGRRRPLEVAVPDAPAALAEVINRALLLDADGRWPTARAMRVPIEAWLRLQSDGESRARKELGAMVSALRAATAPSAGRPETRPVGVPPMTLLSRPPRPDAAPAALGLLDVTPKVVRVGPPTGAKPAAKRRRLPAAVVTGASLAALAVGCIAWAVWGTASDQPSPQLTTTGALPEPQAEADAVQPDPAAEPGPSRGDRYGTPVMTPVGPISRPKRTARGVAAAAKIVPPRKMLAFDAEPAVDVYAGEKLLGRTPVEVPMPGPLAQLRLVSAADGIDYDYALAGEAPQRLKVPQAVLHVRVDPWAEVTLDGRPLGMTPVPPMTVFAGRHVIILVNDDRKIRRQVEVVLAPNESKVVREKL